MKNTHTTLDREPLSSKAIRDRQNFNYVLKEHAATRIPLWKSAWFYGPVGIAMVTMVVSAVRMNPKNDEYDKNTTLSQITQTSTPVELSNHSILASFEGSIAKPAKKEAVVVKKRAKGSTSAQTLDVKKVEIEENTALKPEVLTEEKKIIAPAYTSNETVKVVKKSTMPSIAGVFTGRLSVNTICESGKIECNNDFEIISYSIEYDNGIESTVERIRGNAIPTHLCGYLKRYNIGSPVFITNIVAADSQGNVKRLPSMSIEPTY